MRRAYQYGDGNAMGGLEVIGFFRESLEELPRPGATNASSRRRFSSGVERLGALVRRVLRGFAASRRRSPRLHSVATFSTMRHKLPAVVIR